MFTLSEVIAVFPRPSAGICLPNVGSSFVWTYVSCNIVRNYTLYIFRTNNLNYDVSYLGELAMKRVLVSVGWIKCLPVLVGQVLGSVGCGDCVDQC